MIANGECVSVALRNLEDSPQLVNPCDRLAAFFTDEQMLLDPRELGLINNLPQRIAVEKVLVWVIHKSGGAAGHGNGPASLQMD